MVEKLWVWIDNSWIACSQSVISDGMSGVQRRKTDKRAGKWTKIGQKLSNTHLGQAYSWRYQLSRISVCPLASRGRLEDPKSSSRLTQWRGSSLVLCLHVSLTIFRWHQFTSQEPTFAAGVCLPSPETLPATRLTIHQTPDPNNRWTHKMVALCYFFFGWDWGHEVLACKLRPRSRMGPWLPSCEQGHFFLKMAILSVFKSLLAQPCIKTTQGSALVGASCLSSWDNDIRSRQPSWRRQINAFKGLSDPKNTAQWFIMWS